ncbi:MAG: glycoside hydrolase family 88 protein [Niallia nealsonii]|nr:glycoside hydrolase family 88 protein [Niallia nealsonii]
MDKWLKDARAFIEKKTTQNIIDIGESFPHATKQGHYDKESPQWWTAGFWPGILWNVYHATNEDVFKNLATQLEHKMGYLLNDPNKVDHDIGFMWTLTSLARYQITADETAKNTSLLAANMLLARFNSAGHFFKAWNNWHGTDDNSGIVIIDSMMNMGLLFWTSEETGDPRFMIAAKAHCNMVLKHFIRSDGSVHQMVKFNSLTGELIEKLGGQGYSENSSWSRGCGWAIFGFAIAYHYTKEERYLSSAMKVANHFALHLHQDSIPLWDFRIPLNTNDTKYDYRDSSASAIAACGSLLISQYAPSEEKRFYLDFGKDLLKRLYEHAATIEEDTNHALLSHGTSHWPEKKNLDTGLIYGDYFFTQGIYALNGINNNFWLGDSWNAL